MKTHTLSCTILHLLRPGYETGCIVNFRKTMIIKKSQTTRSQIDEEAIRIIRMTSWSLPKCKENQSLVQTHTHIYIHEKACSCRVNSHIYIPRIGITVWDKSHSAAFIKPFSRLNAMIYNRFSGIVKRLQDSFKLTKKALI